MALYRICLTLSALIALTFATVIKEVPPVYSTVDILDGCSSTYYSYVSRDAGVLVYSRIKSTFHPGSCRLRFNVDYSTYEYGLFVKAEKMALADTGACLQIYDSTSYSTGPKLGEYCGDSLFQLNTTGRYMTVKLVANTYTTKAAFRLVVTPFKKSCSSAYSYFQCDNGECISKELVGDGHQNCRDNSDEKDVSIWPCTNNMFSCGSSALCIASSWKCDRFQDCPNSLDEENCIYECPGSSLESSSSKFECRDGSMCFSSYRRCTTSTYFDGCGDGSENMDCDDCDGHDYNYYFDTSKNDLLNGFSGYCAVNRSCIPKDKWCDGFDDCPNGADEEYNQCHPSIYWYWSSGQLAGLFIGFFIFVAIVIGIVVVVQKKCRKEVG